MFWNFEAESMDEMRPGKGNTGNMKETWIRSKGNTGSQWLPTLETHFPKETHGLHSVSEFF